MQLPFQLKNHHHQHHRGAMEPRLPAAAAGRVWRFRRMLVRVSAAERLSGDCKEHSRDRVDERPPEAAEVGSVGLDRMVLSFMEDAATVERPPRGRCNCFNGSSHYDGSDDEEFDFLPSGYSASAAPSAPAAAGDALEALKGLVQSTTVAERNLLADASRIAERCRKGGKKKADVRRAVADGLAALGYDAGLCKSRWDKSSSIPAGEHEYIDAVVEVPAGAKATTRLIVEVDFRSEFEVARSTKAYRAALQALPPLFVGTPDRLGHIVAVVAEAARQSMKKKGLHFPPWRKPEYMRAKWLSPHVRCSDDMPQQHPPPPTPVSAASFSGEFQLRLDMKTTDQHDAGTVEQKKITVVVSPSPSPSPWRAVVQETSKKRPIAGLASVLC